MDGDGLPLTDCINTKDVQNGWEPVTAKSWQAVYLVEMALSTALVASAVH